MRSGIWGGLVWLACACAAATGWGPLWILEILFLLAPLVVVPLALEACEGSALPGSLRRLQPLAAASCAASFALPSGPAAAALAAPWLALSFGIASRGALRLCAPGGRDPAATAVHAGYVFLPVGGLWFALSRLGAAPLGFEEPLVLLTAIHFHYAAFTTLALIGLAGRLIADARAYRFIVAAGIGGTPLLAAGITLSPALELAGALVLSLGLWGLGTLLLARSRRLPVGPGRWLLVLSGATSFPSMALALLYASRSFTGGLVSLSDMARLHGVLNAFCFCLAGVSAHVILARYLGRRPL